MTLKEIRDLIERAKPLLKSVGIFAALHGGTNMGLDTSHDCWHGPYGAFLRFRNELAVAAGYEVKLEEVNGSYARPVVQIDWLAIERANPGCYAGEWNEPQDDPLIYLIAHSDCDGVIHPAQGLALAARIEELLPKLSAAGPFSPRGLAERFAAGLRKAAEAGEDVDFH